MTAVDFQCRRCGACCRVKDGIVRVSDAEVSRIAAFLGMDEAAFIANETELAPDRKSLVLKSRADGSCAYLTDDNLCRINPVKPDKCRTFPFEWTNPDSRDVCPGLSRQESLPRSKDEIRREMRARRKALSADERAEASAVICTKLARSSGLGEVIDPFEIGSPVAVYLASPDEIDLGDYIERLLCHGCKVVAPRWNGETYELAVLKGLDARHLRRGPMGIMEPVDAEIVPAKEVYGWIVPGLAFTRDGRRLGYGGGWYDRLLADAPKDAVKLGVAHSFQVVDDLPAEPHDILLSAVVDDSLVDNALEFHRTEDGFSARVAVPDLSFRRKRFVALLSAAVLLPVAFSPCFGWLRPLLVELSMGFGVLALVALVVVEFAFLVLILGEFEVGKVPYCWLPPKHLFLLELFAESALPSCSRRGLNCEGLSTR